MKIKLTQRLVDSLTFAGKTPASADRRWDTDLRGFGVRVYVSGEKSYFVAYRHGGRLRFMALGSTEVLNLVQARNHARLRQADVIAGADPLAERGEERRGSTMNDLCKAYAARHANKKKSGIDDLRKIKRDIRPRFGTRRIDSITRAELAQLHHEMTAAGHPTGANRLMSLLSKMFNCAIKWGFLPDNAANPATKIDKNTEAARTRVLSPDEIRRLFDAVRAEDDPYIEALFWLYLLLGNRKTELLRLLWANVDLVAKTVKFVDTKNGTEHLLPLSGPASQIFARLPRVAGNPWVFPGRRAKSGRRSIQGLWERVRERAGLQDVWLHDLRRTVGSWLGRTGHGDHLIGDVLNNSAEVAGKHYVHLNLSPIAAALEAHATALVLVASTVDV